MAAARAHVWLRQQNPERAMYELADVLERFNESTVMNDGLRKELAPYWVPQGEEIE